ncbi:MAG: CHASE4 domain-containing protein, partial [Methylotenera sp.]
MTEKNFKGLRTKILTILAVAMILLFTLLFFVARTALLDGFAQLEKDNTLVYLNSAAGLIQEQVDQLHSQTRDYAHWEDTYQFAISPNQSYIDTNISDEAFANLKINGFVVVDPKGKTIFRKGVDFATGKLWQFPDLLLRAMSNGGKLIDPTKNEISGVFWTPEGSFVISSVDIRNSQSQSLGRRHGTLIMLRPISQDLLRHSSEILAVKI